MAIMCKVAERFFAGKFPLLLTQPLSAGCSINVAPAAFPATPSPCCRRRVLGLVCRCLDCCQLLLDVVGELGRPASRQAGMTYSMQPHTSGPCCGAACTGPEGRAVGMCVSDFGRSINAGRAVGHLHPNPCVYFAAPDRPMAAVRFCTSLHSLSMPTERCLSGVST